MSHIAEVDALGYNGSVHKHLRRLERIWIDSPSKPASFVHTDVAKILIGELRAAHDRHGWAVGRYVIMPDHVHFFCRPELDAKPLSEFMAFWKSYTSRKINALGQPRSAPAATALWQREFFDHALRSTESYSEKWNYVRDNPLRGGLVSKADEWKYAGEIERLML
jgi:REP element-mobilizing transposase RayT